MEKKKNRTLVQISVDSVIHRQFADLAGFLNPGKKKADARNELLDIAMQNLIEKERGK